ncbi:MAG TPA: J domain-containing protein [Acidobacteriaceae bacterium]|jgi:curved DNA-binding protein CbpA|nr:J domain-containing protein [Acidobacteriaceae bacterium]
MPTHYDVLGLPETADQPAIRSAYLRLLHLHHPDHNTGPDADAITAQLIDAYAILGDPGKRARYDRTHGFNQPLPAPHASTHPVSAQSDGARASASSPSTTTHWFQTRAAFITLLTALAVALGLYLWLSPSRVVTHSPRATVNSLIDQFVSTVLARATPAGSHREGLSIVNDYALDRSRYDLSTLRSLADDLQAYLPDSGANSDGLVTRAYFNARLMQLSVATLDDFQKGAAIDGDIEQIDRLGQNPYVHPWLAAGPYAHPFSDLHARLLRMSHAQASGLSRLAAQTNLADLSAQITAERARMQAAGDVPASVASSFNAEVENYNQLSAAGAKNQALYDEVDLAFNRCLDARFLTRHNR